jgi:predicted nucleic acid-binding protein
MVRQALVLDAQPLVAHFLSEPNAEQVRSVLDRGVRGALELLMSVVNAGEVLVAMEREGGAQASHRTLEILQELPVRLVNVDLEMAARAAWFKAGGGISYGDSFAAALAHREGIPLLTGDREFERVADRVEVRWLSG